MLSRTSKEDPEDPIISAALFFTGIILLSYRTYDWGMLPLLGLLFSFCGILNAIVVLKTESIYPSIIFHMVMNIGMVLNGWIV